MAVAKEYQTGRARTASERKATTSRKPQSKKGSLTTKRAATKATKPADGETPAVKPEEQGGRAEAECPDGAARMRVSANIALAANSKNIADGLSAAAARGNPACAKLLMDMIAGKKVSARRLERAVTLAQELKLDEEWEGETQGTVNSVQ